MRILHVATECYPLVRTGGLGDVLGALPVALRLAGDDARLLLPGYQDVLANLAIDAAYPLPAELGEPDGILARATLPATGLPIYLLDVPRRFGRTGNPYLGPDGLDWPDNAERFALLSRTAVALASGQIDPAWSADLIHAHDWHAGLVPAYLGAAEVTLPTVFTIHNMAFQGLFPADRLAALSLSDVLFQPDGLEFWNQISFLKSGIVYADRVTTVSPNYAREIATTEFGCGLEGVIQSRGPAVSGILNGVDDAIWNPAADPLIDADYDLDRLDDREADRRSLLAEIGVVAPPGPLLGVVSRLTEQKGLDLLLEALPVLLASGGALALLGSGDADLETQFLAAARAHPDRVWVRIGYDDQLSHRLIAGVDAMVVPSRFEPCGLTQLYALRYGAVPIVRRTGGLADTVTDATPAHLADGSATGFLFDQADGDALGVAIGRAATLFADKPAWRTLQQNGMRQRFSWREAADAYRTLYRGISRA